MMIPKLFPDLRKVDTAGTGVYFDRLDHTKEVIKCWVESWGVNNVYVAFSGGVDSTVLLHIVRSLFPEVTAVFNNTGLEFPEIVRFVASFDNVITLRPRIPFHKVIEKYGWPVVSKEQSQFIYEYRNTRSDKLRDLRWNGRANGRGKIAEKWKFLVNSPFRISHKCCDKLKKEPAKRFEKNTGKKPLLGVMGVESQLRHQTHSCNLYDARRPVSKPLLHWDKNAIWSYIKDFSLDYCQVYDKGWDRTGCLFCLYGAHLEDPSGFSKLKETHRLQYDYCINKLGISAVLDFLKISY